MTVNTSPRTRQADSEGAGGRRRPNARQGRVHRPRSKALGLERIVFFSDAVMAIAITLLVIDLRLPGPSAVASAADVAASLKGLTPRIVSFVISFAVIGVYWSSHHRYFGYIKRYDSRLMLLNLIFLFFIVLMPFAASMQGQYGYLPVGAAIYGLNVAATGLSIGALWWYASRNHRLVDDDLDARMIQGRNQAALIVPLLFLASIPFAFVSPLIPPVIWWIAPLAALAASRRVAKEHRRAGKGAGE